MKITLDLDQLIADGRITAAEAERLRSYARIETVSLAINAIVIVGVIGVVAATMVLVRSAPIGVVIGLALTAVGVFAEGLDRRGWGALRQTMLVVGTLLGSSSFLISTNGTTWAWLVVAASLLSVALAVGSGLLAVLSALALGPALNAGGAYEHAAYSIIVERPVVAIVVYSLIAVAAFLASGRTSPIRARVLTTLSRAALFLVQFGFWVGSLWGTGRASSGTRVDLWRGWSVSPASFAIAWLLCLIAVGAWAARRGRRWVVNLCVVFGMIDLYTQWFEHLHATPTSVLIASIIALAIALLLRRFNHADGTPVAAPPPGTMQL